MEINQPVFALDIGTRSVVGVLLEPSPGGLRVIHSASLEHSSRSMKDGQIHHIEEVAQSVERIKQTLEQAYGQPLKGVAVAAAGRSLRTVKVAVEHESDGTELRPEDVLALELEGVQQAQRQLVEKENIEYEYQCVGYSVVNYYLNRGQIGNLIGQRGKDIGVELIATFLPREVVDSLFAVLQRAGLEMSSLTLEPIAASEVVIPASMRQLSIALVDIGAGTSDIAISADGSIIGYDMVPEAGDGITEALGHALLLSFDEAERVKRMLGKNEMITFTDALGFEQEMAALDIVASIEDHVQGLANKIALKIKNLCIKPVQGVICIGGGSLTPGFTNALANELGLGSNRVAVRGREVVREVEGEIAGIGGPEAITPLGIGVNAFKGGGLGFARVHVNGRTVRMFELHEGTVADALLAAGIDSRKLIGRPGMALSFTVNGELRLVKGTLGLPAKIMVNNQEATLEATLDNDDVITIVEAKCGQDAHMTVGQLLEDYAPLKIGFNDQILYIRPTVTLNNTIVDAASTIHDLATIEIVYPKTVEDMFAYINYTADWSLYKVFINGIEAQPDFAVEDGDLIEIETGLSIDTQANEGNQTKMEEQQAATVELEVSQTMSATSEVVVLVNGESVSIKKENGQIMFLDIFNHINFSNRPPEPGCSLVMQLNNMPASFTSLIHSGDKIKLEWQEG